MTKIDKSIEEAKLELESQKLELDDKWRKKTYVWTIFSALLTAAVTLSIPLLSGNSSSTKSVSLSAGPVENCLDSLKRINTLGNIVGQTIPELSNAIQIHVGHCNGVLDTLVEELK